MKAIPENFNGTFCSGRQTVVGPLLRFYLYDDVSWKI